MRGDDVLLNKWGRSFRPSAVDILRFALAVYESSASGGIGVDPRNVA